MTITKRVQRQMFDGDDDDAKLICLNPHPAHANKVKLVGGSAGSNQSEAGNAATPTAGQPWTRLEHDRFLEALALYPSGPWKLIAAHVGSRTTRQTMTHAQKYRQKIARRQRDHAPAKAPISGELKEPAIIAAAPAQAGKYTTSLPKIGPELKAGLASFTSPEGKDAVPAEGGYGNARSFLMSGSKVSQAVVSLIQLAEPATAQVKAAAVAKEEESDKAAGDQIDEAVPSNSLPLCATKE